MEGTIKNLKRGYGFVQETLTEEIWYFDFRDLTKLQPIRPGFKVRFEKKESAVQQSQRPAAHKVEILVERRFNGQP
jgi:hypothetical protein